MVDDGRERDDIADQPERRVAPRYEIMAQVRVKRGRINYVLDVRNISISGVFVSTEGLDKKNQFRVGQDLDMVLFEPGQLDQLQVNGRVVRIVLGDGEVAESGVGVQFVDPSPEVRAVLEQVVDRAAEDSLRPPPLPGGPPPLPGDGEEER